MTGIFESKAIGFGVLAGFAGDPLGRGSEK
jgi:hypothetical protein